MNWHAELQSRLRTALTGLVDDVAPYAAMLRPAGDPKFGDYQANCAMPLGKRLSKPPREIAQQMHLGEKTVHSYRFHVKTKLGAKHSAELYSMAARWMEDQEAAQVGIAQDGELEQNARA